MNLIAKKTFELSGIGTYEIRAVVTKEGYSRSSAVYTVHVETNLRDAEVKLAQSEFTYTPDGDKAVEYVPQIQSITFYGTDITDEISIGGDTKGSDAKTYTLTIAPKDGSPFVGTKSVEWNILPRTITKVNVCDYIKTYDGTTTVTAHDIGNNHSYLPHFFYEGSLVDGVVMQYGKDYSITDVTADFTAADAESHSLVTCTIVLANSNYIFVDENGKTTNEKTVSQSMMIGKANTLPTGYEPKEGEIVVRNGADADYTLDASTLLSTLPRPLEYKVLRYALTESNGNTSLIDLNANYYDGGAAIDENGILTLPIKAFNTSVEGNIGTIKIMVCTVNYVDFQLTVKVKAQNQITPSGEPPLLADGTITYGDTVNDVKMTGTLRDDVNKVDVTGVFTWSDPDYVPDAGEYTAEWTFTPTGPNAFMYTSVTGNAKIKINKADIPYSAIQAPVAVDGLVYKIDGSTQQELHSKGSVSGNIGTMKYTTVRPENASDSDWQDTPITSVNAGEFVVYYKVFGDKNHKDSAYGTITCRMAAYKLKYTLVCKPKTYDGKKGADPQNIRNITFFETDGETPITALTANDYTIVRITYDSANVGSNLGADRVEATAEIELHNHNYEIESGKAYGYITPALIPNSSNYKGYTVKVRFNDTEEKTVGASAFGAPNDTDYVLISNGNVSGRDDILGLTIRDGKIVFTLTQNLTANDATAKRTETVTVYTADYNYCSDKLPFTVEIADMKTPDLTVPKITAVYDGNPVPNSAIQAVGKATVDGVDIEGTWSFKNKISPVNVADSNDYTVVFTPSDTKAYYEAEIPVHVTVEPRNISVESVSFRYEASHVYNREPITPKVSAYFGNNALAEGENGDYTVTHPTDATNVGEKKMTVIGHGNFTGEKELSYSVTRCTTKPTLTLLPTEFTYDGSEKRPTVTATVDGKTLTEGTDFSVAYENNTYAEDGAKVTVTSRGNYAFEAVEQSFLIKRADSVIVNAPQAKGIIYDGSAHDLITEGTVNGGQFEYKLGDGEWTKNVPTGKDAGNYTVRYKVIGDRNHNSIGEQSIQVTIQKRDIADADIILGESLTYNRKEQVQTVFVRFRDGSDATFDVTGNRKTDAGTYKLTVTGNGNFTGVRYADFTIAKKEVTAASLSVTVGGSYTYNGEKIEPTDITVTDVTDDGTVIPDTEYAVSFENNIDAGTAKVIITNAEGGNYIVTGNGTFRIDKAHITVKPKDVSKTYGDAVAFELKSESSLITSEELAQVTKDTAFTCDGEDKTAPVIPESYTITASINEGKNETKNLILTVSGTGTLTVVPKKLTIKVNDVSRVYGEENPELSVTYDGFVNGEDESVLSGTLVLSYVDIDSTTAVGPHTGAAVASGLTSTNYSIEYLPGDVTITRIPVRMSAGISRGSVLSLIFDKALDGLTAANFNVKDPNGNTVAVSEVTVASDNQTYTLKGKWEAEIEYTVKVTLDGAVVSATHQLVDDTIILTPLRSNNVVVGPTYCTVTFVTNGGSNISARNVLKGTTVKKPASPVREGYDFVGWYTDSYLDTEYDFSQKVNGSLTLYAAWKEKGNTKNQIIFTIGEKAAQVFGVTQYNDVAPIITNNRTMLPARFAAENLGAEVSWDSDRKLVTVKGKNLKTGEDVTILIYIDSDTAYVNGKEVKLDSPAFIQNNRTYTPLRFISEELGASVEWRNEERKVVITKPQVD